MNFNDVFDEPLFDKKSENTLPPYSFLERAVRKLTNSPEFDRASYEADGGPNWIDPRRKEFFTHPKDGTLWLKAKAASMDAYGDERWQFTLWWYLKNGGVF